jgi:hypothetical protein
VLLNPILEVATSAATFVTSKKRASALKSARPGRRLLVQPLVVRLIQAHHVGLVSFAAF